MTSCFHFMAVRFICNNFFSKAVSPFTGSISAGSGGRIICSSGERTKVAVTAAFIVLPREIHSVIVMYPQVKGKKSYFSVPV